MSPKGFEKILLLLAVLGSLMVMSTNTADPDLWGHVQYGRDWIRAGAMPVTSTYTFTAEGFPWVNHENFAELAMAAAVDLMGPAGLIVLRTVLALALIGLVLHYNLRNGYGVMASSLILLLLAWNLGFHFSYRPQVATMFFLALMLWVIQVAFRGWRSRWHLWLPEGNVRRWMAGDSPLPEGTGHDSWSLRWLWMIPPILFLWTNSHGGFLAGLAIFGVLLGFRTLEAFQVMGRRAWPISRRFTLMLAAAWAAALINPYSIDLIRWMIYSVGNHRPEISDWGNVELWTITGLKFWILTATLVFSIAFSRRPKDLAEMVILGLVFWQATHHFRHVQVFAILTAFWVGPHLHSTLQRLAGKGKELAEGLSPRVPVWQSVAAGAVAMGMLAGLVPRLDGIRVDRREYPVDAMQYLVDQRLTGRTLVSFDWAQYFIAAMCADQSPLGPQSRVSFDGRFDTCYPREHIDYHFDFLAAWSPLAKRNRSATSEPFDPTRVLRLGDPELVLNRRINELSAEVMQQESANWVLLYQDPLAQIWGRRSIFDDPLSPRYVRPEQRSIDRVTPTGYARWPALPVLQDAQPSATVRESLASLPGRH